MPPRKSTEKTCEHGSSKSEETESHPAYLESEWLSEVYPNMTPYFPQIGDEVVYYRQGHELYLKFVEKKNLYEISKKLRCTFPFVCKPRLKAAVLCRVGSIKFELLPHRVVILKLHVINWRDEEHTGIILTVQYHHIADVPDFIILRQFHDNYVRQKWNPGDRKRRDFDFNMGIDLWLHNHVTHLRFRCLIGRQWFVGTVDGFQPQDTKFPESKFMCYNVTWNCGASEKLSPWDMDKVTDSFAQLLDGDEFVEVTDQEIRRALYKPNKTDWPPHGHRDRQCAKLSRLMEQVMGLAISETFLAPVDLKHHLKYAMNVAYPMDLWTIKARLDNLFYRRTDALRYDFMILAFNAEKLHEPESVTVNNAKMLRDVCLELVKNPEKADVKSIYSKLREKYMNQENTKLMEFPPSSITIQTKASSDQTPGCSSSAKSLKKRTCDNDTDDGRWKEKCRDLLEKIWKCKDAIPFRAPIDPETYPEYYDVISTPMDLRTVRKNLLDEKYKSPVDFNRDMTLIFKNSMNYNSNNDAGSKSVYNMTVRLQTKYRTQIRLIVDSYRSLEKKNPSSKCSVNSKRNTNDKNRSSSNSSDEGVEMKRARISKNKLIARGSSNESASTSSSSGSNTRKKHFWLNTIPNDPHIKKKLTINRLSRPQTSPSKSSSKSQQQTDSESTSDDEIDDHSWNKRCLDFLRSIKQCSYYTLLKHPVDSKEHLDYHQLIDKPLDLKKVVRGLINNNYACPQDFHKDMMLILNNFIKYFNLIGHQDYNNIVELKRRYEIQMQRIIDSYRTSQKRSCTPSNRMSARKSRVDFKSSSSSSKTEIDTSVVGRNSSSSPSTSSLKSTKNALGATRTKAVETYVELTKNVSELECSSSSNDVNADQEASSGFKIGRMTVAQIDEYILSLLD